MIVLLVLACKNPPPVGPPSPASWVEESGAVGAEVLGAAGDERAVVVVRAFNAFGGSTSGPDARLKVDGEAFDVELGAQGYGEVELDEPGTYQLAVGTTEAMAYVYGVEWPGFAMMRGEPAPMRTDRDAISGGSGVLTIEDDEVWWAGRGAPPHRVLTTDGTIGGMVNGAFDGDGVLDAAVWSGRSIHFLRGRSDGGMTYAGQLRSPTHTVAGMDFGDATNDGVPDLNIAWVGPPSAGRLDIWESDGLLDFTPGPNRLLTVLPFDVTVGDNTGEGRSQITVTIDGGNWERYFQAPVGYAPSGPALELDLSQFTRVYSPGDMNRDGSDELIFVPPRIPGADRRIIVFDLDDEVPTFTGITRLDAHIAIDDLDDDGLVDLLFTDAQGDLVAVHANPDGEGLETDSLLRGLPESAPIARVPGESRLLVAGQEDWLWIDGRSSEEEWFLTEDPILENVGLAVRDGQFQIGELDGDPASPDLVGLRTADSGNTELRVWSLKTTGAEVVGSVVLDDALRDLRDLAVCGSEAWVLLEDRLARVDLTDAANPVETGSVPVDAQRVACGDGPAGPVALLTEAGAFLLDDDLLEVGVVPSSGAFDLHLDALGTTTCDREGCRVIRAPVGPDGSEVTVSGWAVGAEIDDVLVFGRGVPSVADVDRNGHPDVLFHDSGRIVLYRHTGESLGAPEIFHTRRPIGGGVAIADFDGDGFHDVWAAEPDNGRIRVSTSVTNPGATPDPVDTSDTGSPAPTGETGSTGDTGVN